MATEIAHVYGTLPEQAQEGQIVFTPMLHHAPTNGGIDALHATRLLNVEEKHFHRVAKNLLAKDSPLKILPKQPEGEEVPEQTADEIFKRQKFREDVLLDFASLESSILRIQLIQSSNERERQRYATEKAKILETAQAVRDNTVELRTQLEDAQRVLDLRKGYDGLAAKILDDKKLKSRDESQADIEKLEKEIEDLQQENAEFEGTWSGRKEQFDRVVAEGEAMVRLIKGIKDDPEKDDDEHMEEDGENGKDPTSRVGTPGLGGQSPMRDGANTPLGESADTGKSTPFKPNNRFLDIEDSTRLSTRDSQATSPVPYHGDVEMAESGSVVVTDAAAAEPETETMDES